LTICLTVRTGPGPKWLFPTTDTVQSRRPGRSYRAARTVVPGTITVREADPDTAVTVHVAGA